MRCSSKDLKWMVIVEWRLFKIGVSLFFCCNFVYEEFLSLNIFHINHKTEEKHIIETFFENCRNFLNVIKIFLTKFRRKESPKNHTVELMIEEDTWFVRDNRSKIYQLCTQLTANTAALSRSVEQDLKAFISHCSQQIIIKHPHYFTFWFQISSLRCIKSNQSRHWNYRILSSIFYSVWSIYFCSSIILLSIIIVYNLNKMTICSVIP